MYRVTKEFRFEMAHKLSESYTCKCQHIHGHSYRAKVTIISPQVNNENVVIDFTKIKEVLGNFINLLDHNFIIHAKDPAAGLLIDGAKKGLYPLIVAPVNPTAEYIAALLCAQLQNALEWDASIRESLPVYEEIIVEVFETATSSATKVLKAGEMKSGYFPDFHPTYLRFYAKYDDKKSQAKEVE